jgi:hypothetical protein
MAATLALNRAIMPRRRRTRLSAPPERLCVRRAAAFSRPG